MMPPMMADSWALRWGVEAPWPWWIAAVGAAGLTAGLYRRPLGGIDGAARWGLPALRSAAVGLIVLLIAAPAVVRQSVIGRPGRLRLVVDGSASMDWSDSAAAMLEPAGPAENSRLARATALLDGSASQAGLSDRLANTHRIERIMIGDAVATTDLSPAFEIWGSTAGIDDGEPAGWQTVLLTDGRQTAGSADLVAAAGAVTAAGGQVHVIGIGSPEEPPDAGLVSVDHPEVVGPRSTLAGSVRVKRSDPAAGVRVQIRHRGDVVWSQKLDSGDPAAIYQDVPFSIAVEDLVGAPRGDEVRGIDRRQVTLPLSVEIVTDAAVDAFGDNNQTEIRVAAGRRRRRVLLVDSDARWETRYLRNLLVRDPSWEVDTVLLGHAGTNEVSMPAAASDWLGYDAVVLGDVDPGNWTTQWTAGLQSLVTGGGGLVAIDGPLGRLASLASVPAATLNNDPGDTPLSIGQMLPVDLAGSRWVTTESLSLTPEGERQASLASHVAADAWGGELSNDDWLSRMPPPSGVRLTQPAAGAQVWAHAMVGDSEPQAGSRTAWLVSRSLGSGQVVYVASDQTWRWRAGREAAVTGPFWNQLLLGVMAPPHAAADSLVAIGTDALQYDVGESAELRVRLTPPAGATAGPADRVVQAQLFRDDRVVGTIAMRPDRPGSPTYTAVTGPLEAGEYRVGVRVGGYDASQIRAQTQIWVGRQDLAEFDRVAIDEPAMRRWAAAGGGTYVHESEAESLIEQLIATAAGEIRTDEVRLHRWPPMLGLVVALLAAEWWIRKRVGLL